MIKRYTFLIFVFIAALWSCQQATEQKTLETTATENMQHLPPDDRYGQLFIDVQMAKVFPDGKTFVDCTPKFPTNQILENYEKAKAVENFDLKKFVSDHFELPKQYASGFKADTSRSAQEHINTLWPILTRNPDKENVGTLISLPYSYIVPGGRFGEIYYWDSYFTMLGLQSSNQVDMIENMVNNFGFLIDSLGFIPNGNRTYFNSRSQPPFYAAMLQILAEEKDDVEVYSKYLPFLEKEYAFWTYGEDQLENVGDAFEHSVKVDENTILSRYWDRKNTPRQEMHHDDIITAEKTDRPDEELFRDIRAACESGWDFSSRWFRDPQDLSTIHTTEIIPVDLNALLYNLESTLAKAYAASENMKKAAAIQKRANDRKAAVLKYCWNEEKGYFMDYDFVKGEHTAVPSLAGVYPLYFKMATPDQIAGVAKMIEAEFLKPGGLISTLNITGQQWDAPNGWAPLQWLTIKGLRNYGQNDLANTIKERWVNLNKKVYKNTGKMVEKYNVMDLTLEAGGGEYPVQDGFGWTNGVLLKLLTESDEQSDPRFRSNF
jgi:alpha,alpha-trehalase